MSEPNEIVLPCPPVSTRRSQVSGPVSEKLVTEDCEGVGTQAPSSVNTTGLRETNKKLVQQAFHPSLFLSRPRSASMSSVVDANAKNIDLARHSTDEQTLNVVGLSENRDANPPAWQRVPNIRNAKRKKMSTPSPEKISISNRFSGLPTDQLEENCPEQSDAYIKTSKPPPIILYGIEDVNKLTELLEGVVNKIEFTYKIVNKNQLRISSNDVDAFKKIIDVIRKNGLIGHTFNRKDKRPYRIVIRNLHHSTPLCVIKETLEDTGNTVVGEIINAKYGPDKRPTSTFFVNLAQGPCNKAVKNVKYIYHQCVTIEDPRKRNTVVQCQRCQQYGHTKNYCMRPYRCVKCAESHKTSDCPKKDRSLPAKCALCLGAHPANYKGCEVYREILARKTAKQTHLKSRNNLSPIIDQPSTTQPTQEMYKPKLADNKQQTYAKVTQSKIKNDKEDLSSLQTSSRLMEDLLFKQAEKFDLILQQMSTLIGLMTTLVSKLVK
ncbi:unnamed protein product [Euphydryas editha]|uniref:Pre-C2HC domain-containing protein n=1 Tax=Euphydryas editha TaxID=104508 RepID=A0AAU9UCZ9_EUPED|nr:unnamed protein product [Euphydryas editha]